MFVVLLVAVSTSGVLGFVALHRQVERGAQAGAIETARVVATLTVGRNLTHDQLGSTDLAGFEVRDLDGDVAALLADGKLAGLEIWRGDGTSVYSNPGHGPAETAMPPDQRGPLARSDPWVVEGPEMTDRDADTYDVFLPFDVDGDDAPDLLVEVLFQQNGIADAIAGTTRRLVLGVALFVVGASVAMAGLRRRGLRRAHHASHDQLTGLMNWGAFRDAFDRADRRAVSNGPVGALLVVDLDQFRQVNDALGHPAGDELLVRVGEALERSVRPGDVVARLGGDEFAVLMSGLADEETAARLARQLLDRLCDGRFVVSGIEVRVEASIGVALIPRHADDLDALLRCGEVAMCLAKRAGVGVTVYNDTADQRRVDELALLGELRDAIVNDHLVLYYQPKVGLTDHDIQGVEALVRWQHPTRGLLPPDAFIGLAENTGLMTPLTHWVLRTAVHQGAIWARGGLPLSIAVNVTPRGLLEPDLAGTILAELAESGFSAASLEIEITETAVMSDPERASAVLRDLRMMGVRIAVDDFGTGYTSLSALTTLPVDTLKIDKSFIADMTVGGSSEAVVRSIIDLGHRLGLSVLAEGVETAATASRLEYLGCDEGQGYLFARPLPAAQVEGWVTDHRATNNIDLPLHEGSAS